LRLVTLRDAGYGGERMAKCLLLAPLVKNLRPFLGSCLGNPLGYEELWIMQPHRQKQRDELAPSHLTISSARASSVGTIEIVGAAGSWRFIVLRRLASAP
jgi:hypothetical protein